MRIKKAKAPEELEYLTLLYSKLKAEESGKYQPFLKYSGQNIIKNLIKINCRSHVFVKDRNCFSFLIS